MTIRIVSATDSGMVRQALEAVLTGNKEFEYSAAAASLAEAQKLIFEDKPDVLLLDFSLIDPDGLNFLQNISVAAPWLRVIGIITRGDEKMAMPDSDLTLAGILYSDEIEYHLIDAVLSVANGENWLPPDISMPVEPPQYGELLTERELEILEMLGSGKSNKTIADVLNITVSTVRFHVGNILHKLGASNRTDAVIKAVKLGIINIEE